MAHYTASRWTRLAIGMAIIVAGALVLIAQPGVALAHHVTVTESGDCGGWDTKAEYFGGDGDRKVVIDVTINGEHIGTTLYFDPGVGHLGHTNYYLLFERSGTGSLHTFGTVTMYERFHGVYSHIVNGETLGMNFDCEPTAIATSTATASATATPVPPTNTPTALTTVTQHATPTPQATHTSTATATTISEDTVTPNASAPPTSTVSHPVTPASTNTAVTRSLATPGPESTPTFVSIVHGSTRPGASLEPASPVARALPATGQGASTARIIVAGLFSIVLGAIGLIAYAGVLRVRRLS